ncbi:MAG: Gfo/Idh/MocA family oxidoreductase [Magnetococcales bacterium]|nr:Gfo/Idh/MocA family oxidoreductase [Magnetococcales bacterium]
MITIVKLGFLGAGVAACHHAAVARVLGGEVVAATTSSGNSPNWEKFQQHAPDAEQLTNGDEILNNPDIDGVVACMSWDVMPLWAERLLKCKKPVLIEKPVTLTAAPLQAIVSSLDYKPDNKLFGYNRRYYDPVIRLKKRINEGGLKAASVIISEAVQDHVKRRGKKVVEHLIPFICSHTIDLILHLFGTLHPVDIRPYHEVGLAHPFISYNGMLLTAQGTPINIGINANDPSPMGVRCLFDDGTTWHLSPLEVLTVFKGYEIQQPTADYKIRRYTPKIMEQHFVDTTMKPGYKEQMAAFLTGNYGPGATIDDAIDVLKLIESL